MRMIKKGCIDVKKNKDIEVELNEITKQKDGEVITCYQLVAGKKVIGTIEPVGESKYQAIGESSYKVTTKSVDDACEELIKYWNLHN